MMTNENLCFQRKTPAPDGIHNDIQFNEYVNDGTRWVTVGQLLLVTLAPFALMVLYVLFAWMEGA